MMPVSAIPMFCGQPVSSNELELIQDVCGDLKNLSQTEIAATVCELMNWIRPNGQLKIRECYGYLQHLQKSATIELPATKQGRPKGSPTRIRHSELGKQQDVIRASLRDIGPVELSVVRRPHERDLWNELIDRYHYLGFTTPFGAQIRYIAISSEPNQRPLACLQFSSPAWKVVARDQWIGWSSAKRATNLQRVVQNSRFLILPWVEVKNLASHALAMAARRLPGDWFERFGVCPVLLETFVETRFKGTCYRAANWLPLGKTKGRGRMDQNRDAKKSPKSIWVLPLVRNCREALIRDESLSRENNAN